MDTILFGLWQYVYIRHSTEVIWSQNIHLTHRGRMAQIYVPVNYTAIGSDNDFSCQYIIRIDDGIW